MNNPLDKYSLQELRAIVRGKLEPPDEWLMQVAAHAIMCQIEGIQQENSNRLSRDSFGQNERFSQSMDELRMTSIHLEDGMDEETDDELIPENSQTRFQEAIKAIA